MRKIRLLKNTISSLLLQFTTIICGLILPRLFLFYYGSEVNGLISSITQFLSIISFLEMGLGVVVQSALYQPLARRDDAEVSKILVSASRFFKIIAIVLLGYIIALVLFYPNIVETPYDFMYTAILIVAMGTSSFVQYYFGIVDRLLLTADQKGYIQYSVQILTLVFNTILSVGLIMGGASIQLVKITTSLVFIVRPLILRLYVNHHYKIDRAITFEKEPIKQKWSGFAQHVSAVVVDNTDMIVLTVFSTLSNVSIYSVYYMIVVAVKQIILALSSGIQSLFGNLLANNEMDKLKDVFVKMEMAFAFTITYLYSCVACLILQFVQVYTLGINDANYYVPEFAILISVAYAMFCMRIVYYTLIKAAGHFKETQRAAIAEAAINVIVSVFAVTRYGLVGVAIGTLIAVLFRTIHCVWYLSKKIIRRDTKHFVKNMGVNLICGIFCYWCSGARQLEELTYISWVILAVQVAFVNLVICGMVYLFSYRKNVLSIIKK